MSFARFSASTACCTCKFPTRLADVCCTQDKLALLPDRIWSAEEAATSNVLVIGRDDNLNAIKPGVDSLMLMFSHQQSDQVFMFPYYDLLAQELEPLLSEVCVVPGMSCGMPAMQMEVTCHAESQLLWTHQQV